MKLRNFAIAGAALSLAVSPIAVQAAAGDRALAPVDDESEIQGVSTILIVAALAVVAAGIIIIADDDDDDEPVSP